MQVDPETKSQCDKDSLPSTDAPDDPPKGADLWLHRIDKHWAKLTLALTPLIVLTTAIFEAGFFDAIGIRNPYTIQVLLPIPLQELLRSALSATLVLVTVVIVAGSLYFGFATLGKSIARVAYSAWRVFSFWRMFAGQQREKVPTSGVTSRLFDKCNELFLKVRRELFLVTWLLIYVFVVFPGFQIVLDYLQPSMNLGKSTLFLCGYLLVFSEFFEVIVRIAGVTPPAYLRGAFTPLSSTLLILGIALSLVYSGGYQMGVDDVEGASNFSSRIAIPGSKCPLSANSRLLRAYSNGAIVLDDKQLLWIPNSEQPCWRFPLEQRIYEVKSFTPTLFGMPIEALKSVQRTPRPTTAGNR